MNSGQIVITPGLANMLYRMWEVWSSDPVPYSLSMASDEDLLELKNFATQEPQTYELQDGGIQLVFNIFNGGRDD